MKPRAFIVAFLAGAILASALLFVLAFGGSGRLAADLRATRWSLESATRTNTELAESLRRVSIELNKSNGLALAQQSIITDQQSQLGDQQRIIDGIVKVLDSGGKDIRGKISAIAESSRRLYRFYYPDDLADRFPKH